MAGRQQQEDQGGPSMFKSTLFFVFFIYLGYMFMVGGAPKVGGNTPIVAKTETGALIERHQPLHFEGEVVDVHIYVSPEAKIDFQNADLIHVFKSLTFSSSEVSNWNPSGLPLNFTWIPPPETLHNGTAYMHVFLATEGEPLEGDGKDIIYRVYNLTEYRLMPKVDVKYNLISGGSEEEKRIMDMMKEVEGKILSHWCGELSIELITDFSSYPLGKIPEDIRDAVVVNEELGHKYENIIFFNDFWRKETDCTIMNSTMETGVKLSLNINGISLWKFRLMKQFSKSMKESQAGGSGMNQVTGEELDELKRILMETNPVLLVVTAVVTVFHTIFDFLAFKNEIQFWRADKPLEGLSLRTLFLNAFSELIIFLYLLDNDTSWIVLVSAFVGILIEFWKITKGFDISFDQTKAFPLVIKEKDGAGRSAEVKEYDEQAMRYLSYALYPLAIGYAIWELLSGSHKSWYSYVLNSLTGFVLTFGFIRMCPQLFINYKMKSVAHIPWRAFTYKSLNTFIDDLFAFVVKMPMLHRIGCFRDDIVFFIFLYQKWIYPVDKTRVNEFGQSFVDPKTKEKEPEKEKSE